MKKQRSRKKSLFRPGFWVTLLLLITLLGAGGIGLACLYLNEVVVSKFEGHKWALPARVYAQPMALYAGADLLPDDVQDELNALSYQWVAKVTQPGQASRKGNEFDIYTRRFAFWDKVEPARLVHLSFSGRQLQRLNIINGEAGSLVRLEAQSIGAISPHHTELRDPVNLEEISPLLGEALLATEDRRFLDHHGISVVAIARAFWINLLAGEVVQGGSTLTQQLVKNFYLTQDRTLLRKAQEVIMSLLLEWHYSKREILETYINEVYLGQSGPHAVHGFGLAARHYFGKGADQLSIPETALLVGMVKGASYYNPWRNPERAKQRRNVIIGVMLEQGLISAEEARQASAAGLGVVPYERRKLQNYPAFLELVRRQLREDYSDEELSSEGLKLFTSLVPGVQRRAENALKTRLPELEKRYGLKADSLQGGLVVTDVGSGDVLAVVGDRNPQFVGFNRALDVQRPIGSLIKPAVYLAALQSGKYHWASLISDAPVSVKGQDGKVWEPRNYNRRSNGDVLMIDALTYSYNQATARLGMQVGLGRVHKTMVGLAGKGLADRFPPYPSILLGAVNLSPFEVAGMYHTIANDGVRAPLRAIQAVVDSQGRLLSRYHLSLETVMSPSDAYLLQYGMQAVMQRGTGRGAYKTVPTNIVLAGKTGTTNDQRDSWFAGFGDNYLAVAWIGRDDNGKTPLTGSSGALAVWSDLFASLPVRSFAAREEPSIVALWVDETNGKLTQQRCDGARLLPFESGVEPVERGDCEWFENTPVKNWFNRLFGQE